MRPIMFAAAVLAVVACSDQGSSGPTSPTSAALAASRTQAQGSAQLPLHGSLTTTDQGVVVPPNLLVQGTGEGYATQLGRFTATYSAVAGLGTSTATGDYSFTAANGDQLFATFIGSAVDIAPGVMSFTEIATIVGGTGRFVAATGTFTLRRIGVIDYATGTSTSTGVFDGYFDLTN